MFPDTQLLATGHQAPVLSLAIPALMVLPVNEFPSFPGWGWGGMVVGVAENLILWSGWGVLELL